jgi:hypothetical protein
MRANQFIPNGGNAMHESVAGPEKCWPGHRKVGTQPGTGKNAGKRVNDCEKIGEENKGLYYNVNKRKAAGTSRPASSPKAPTAQAWKDAAKTAKNEGLAEDAARAEAQAAYMQGECMILAVAINQLNPKRYPIGYIWEYNTSAGAPDVQLDDDEWDDLTPQEQQEISQDISRHSVVHAYVRDQETNEYIDARGRHKTLPNLWGRMGQTRFDEFPGTARELIDITAHGDWDEVGEKVDFKRGQPAFDSLSGPAGVKRAQEYAVKYLGVEGPSTPGVKGSKNKLRIGNIVRAVDDGKRVQGEVIDIFPEYGEVQLWLSGVNDFNPITVNVRDIESVSEQGVAEGREDLELYGLRIGDTVRATIGLKRVQGNVIDIFPETQQVELLLRGPNAGKTVTVDVQDTEALTEAIMTPQQVAAAKAAAPYGYNPQTGKPNPAPAQPAATPTAPAQPAAPTQQQPAAAPAAPAATTAPAQPAQNVQQRDPNFAAGLAAAQAGKSPTEMMLAQPDIANNQKLVDQVATTLGLPAGTPVEQVRTAAAKRATSATPAGAEQKAIDDMSAKQGFPAGLTKDQFYKMYQDKLNKQQAAMMPKPQTPPGVFGQFGTPPQQPAQPAVAEGEKIGNMDADDFDAAMARLKKLAGAGPMKTVYDPQKRVYRNMPTAQQPAQQPKK